MVNFKLFIVEVKKPGNFSNSRLETDLVKLGKEMQVVLDKLIKKKVESPEVVALLIGGKLGLAIPLNYIIKCM